MYSDKVLARRLVVVTQQVMKMKGLTISHVASVYGQTSTTLYNWINGYATPSVETALYLLESILTDFPDGYTPAKAGRPPKAKRGGLPARVDA